MKPHPSRPHLMNALPAETAGVPLAASVALFAAVVLVASALAACSFGAVTGGSGGGSPLVGKPAPAVDLPTTSGGPLSLSSYKGKPVLLSFFASW
jgi:cytochrome oxidase Cu insertion factor (SCO1/SenC/PrrC family)